MSKMLMQDNDGRYQKKVKQQQKMSDILALIYRFFCSFRLIFLYFIFFSYLKLRG